MRERILRTATQLAPAIGELTGINQAMRNTRDRVAGRVLWEASKTIRHEIIDEGENFLKAREHLETGGGIIVVINHPHKYDTVVIGHAIEEHLSALDKVAALTALKHSDPERHKLDSSVSKSEYTLIDLGQKSKKFMLLRVVQNSDEEREYYTKHPEALEGKSIAQFNSDSMKQAIEILKTGGVVMVAPGGTRDENGVIREAQPGVELLLRGAKENTLILPIGIVPPEDGKIHIGKTRVKLVVGDLLSPQELEAEHTENPTIKRKDLIMRRVARLIPKQYRGIYATS